MIAIAILVTFTTFAAAIWWMDTPKAFAKSWWRGVGSAFMAGVCLLPLLMYVAFCMWAQTK